MNATETGQQARLVNQDPQQQQQLWEWGEWRDPSDPIDLTDDQKTTLNILFTIYFVVYLLLFIFAVYNSVRFVLPKISIRSPQIWGFYAFAIVVFFLEVFGFVYTLCTGPEEYIHSHDFVKVEGQTVYTVACIISDQLVICIYILMTLTLYHIYLAIAKVNGKYLDVTRRWQIARVVYLLTTTIILLELVPSLMALFRQEVVYSNELPKMISSTVLIVVYVTILCGLWGQLKQLEDLEHERSQILQQSCAFVVTFLLTLIQFATSYHYDNIDKDVLQVTLASFLSFLEKILAPTWVMICHYRAFSMQLQLELQSQVTHSHSHNHHQSTEAPDEDCESQMTTPTEHITGLLITQQSDLLEFDTGADSRQAKRFLPGFNSPEEQHFASRDSAEMIFTNGLISSSSVTSINNHQSIQQQSDGQIGGGGGGTRPGTRPTSNEMGDQMFQGLIQQQEQANLCRSSVQLDRVRARNNTTKMILEDRRYLEKSIFGHELVVGCKKSSRCPSSISGNKQSPSVAVSSTQSIALKASKI